MHLELNRQVLSNSSLLWPCFNGRFVTLRRNRVLTIFNDWYSIFFTILKTSCLSPLSLTRKRSDLNKMFSFKFISNICGVSRGAASGLRRCHFFPFFGDFRHHFWAYFLCYWAEILICWYKTLGKQTVFGHLGAVHKWRRHFLGSLTPLGAYVSLSSAFGMPLGAPNWRCHLWTALNQK